MQKKSSRSASVEDALKKFAADEIESSMVLLITEDGERMYLHPFEDELHALEFLELMVASYRVDMLERAVKRSMN